MAAGSRCAVPPASVTPPDAPPAVQIGDTLAPGRYSMVMDATWYGLPPARDGWVYYRIDDEVFRVDWRTLTVLDRATDEAGANWP